MCGFVFECKGLWNLAIKREPIPRRRKGIFPGGKQRQQQAREQQQQQQQQRQQQQQQEEQQEEEHNDFSSTFPPGPSETFP